MKQLLFIFRHSPYQSAITKDGFDALFAAASFDQTLSVLFIDEGVWALQQNQDSRAIDRKNLEKFIQAFELYDITDVYASSNSLSARGLEQGSLNLDAVKVVDETEIHSLFNAHAQVLSF